MTGVIVRIALRYLSGVLVAYGLMGNAEVGVILNDPELEREIAVAVGALFAAIVEGAYAVAKRLGWST
jgi:tetrahydromethanopterin S-methyltransferase subunit E